MYPVHLKTFLIHSQSDLKRHITEKDIQEIVTSQSQKRDLQLHRSNSAGSNGSNSSNGVTYAAVVTKSNSYTMGQHVISNTSNASQVRANQYTMGMKCHKKSNMKCIEI